MPPSVALSAYKEPADTAAALVRSVPDARAWSLRSLAGCSRSMGTSTGSPWSILASKISSLRTGIWVQGKTSSSGSGAGSTSSFSNSRVGEDTLRHRADRRESVDLGGMGGHVAHSPHHI